MARLSNEDKYQNMIDDMELGEKMEFFKSIRANAKHLYEQYPGRRKALQTLSRKAFTRQDGKHVADYRNYVMQMKRQLKARNQELDDPHNI